VPPQVLTKVQQLILYLDYIKITSQIAYAVGEAFGNMIPKNLNQMYLQANDITDLELKLMLQGMNEIAGLKVFALL
jgi:hypothetical protein